MRSRRSSHGNLRSITNPRPTEANIEVLPATPDQFDAIYPLLLGFANPTMSRDDWRRMLFDLPWPVEEPHRGYVLRDAGEVVGFLGTHFSRREVNGVVCRFACTSSWIVKETHRRASLQLVRPLLALEGYTIVNHAPSETAHAIFARLGLVPFESGQVLIPPLPGAGDLSSAFRCSVTTNLATIRAALPPGQRKIADDMSGTLASQVLIRCGARSSHVIATRSPWKGRWRLAHVQYASDWDLVGRFPGRLSAALFRTLGTVGLRIDARHARGPRPRLAVMRSLAPPRLYRPAMPLVTPETIDGLYSEFVGQRW